MVVYVLQVILACEVMDIIHYMEMERVGKRLWVLLLIRAGDLYLELHPETFPASGTPAAHFWHVSALLCYQTLNLFSVSCSLFLLKSALV